MTRIHEVGLHQNFMQGCMVSTQKEAPQPPKRCELAITSQHLGEMPSTLLGDADDVKSLQTCHTLLLTTFTVLAPLYPSPGGERTYWDHCQRLQELSSTYQLPSTILLSGQKKDQFVKLRPTRWKNSLGSTSYAGTASHTPLSLTTTPNSKLRHMKIS